MSTISAHTPVGTLRFLYAVTVLLTLNPALQVLAQDAVSADDAPPWVRSAIGTASGSQAGFQNWAEGGVNTLALSLGLNGTASRSEGVWSQKHTLRLTYGIVKQDTLDFRKAEDLIRFTSSLTYDGDGTARIFKPTVAFGVRTQFAPGFNFDKDPLDSGATPPVKVSDLLSPGSFTESVGLSWEPATWFSQRLGVGAKQTVVLIDRLRPLYGVDPQDPVRYEVGIEAFTDVDREVFENVRYKSTLGLFAAFNSEDKPDMVWENLVTMKVNSWLQVNFEWVFLFDEDISSQVQIKEVFSVGVSYNLL
ncbi:MAG: hypothetical protein COV99_05070 [Bacteroidetes bacterium CG12_big_fil_rev_8_21_14_0_65_60_17]|nr:MAG: hypothetical protein COV99_05070 [Bacteroidetes bacterium CG12_big_fil_rev_8_21_14_0_65_60_17]